MDYVFFGFSSLCLGFLILLLFVPAQKSNRPLRLWSYLTAAGAAVVFYYLNVTVFHEQMPLYYLFNVLPQVLLFAVLAFLILKKTPRTH